MDRLEKERARRAIGAVIVATLVACGASEESPRAPGDDPQDAGAQGDAGGGANDEAGGDACATATCSRMQCNALDPSCSFTWDCAPTELCGRASFLKTGGSVSSSTSGGEAERYDTNGPDTVENARCILEALRDGKVGRVQWGWSGGVAGYGQVIDIVEGRRAFGTFNESFDSPTVKGGFAAVPLKPASHFEACLATEDVDAYARCLESALEPCP